jgi:hypothetical protein
MSKAHVQFLRLDAEHCPPGEVPQRFTFRCVRGNRNRHAAMEPQTCGNLLIANSGHDIARDPQGNNGGRPQWDWDGDRQCPTFSPSINCSAHCGWHGYIRAGRCVDTGGNDEA